MISSVTISNILWLEEVGRTARREGNGSGGSGRLSRGRNIAQHFAPENVSEESSRPRVDATTCRAPRPRRSSPRRALPPATRPTFRRFRLAPTLYRPPYPMYWIKPQTLIWFLLDLSVPTYMAGISRQLNVPIQLRMCCVVSHLSTSTSRTTYWWLRHYHNVGNSYVVNH